MPRLGVIVAALCLAAASCGGPETPAASTPPVNSLTVRSRTVDGLAARCGTLIVPEDRLTGRGRTIGIRFVAFPATGPDRAPDPVVYFAGGPGSSAIDDIPTWLPDLQSLNVDRDLVFIDQRGTGQSNPLNCPAFPSTLADKAALRASVRSCLAHLHGDLQYYTTAMFTDDVSQILTDLHYAKADLIGGSYGPTAEQVFLLRHPGQVRTMTLLNGTLLTVPLFEQEPENSQFALDHVFTLCASQPACHRAFPHLAADWAAPWASLGRSPWVLPAAQSPTGQTFRLDQDTLADWMYQALHASDIAPIPVIVHTLGTAADKAAALASVVKAIQAAGLAGTGGGVTPMMQYEIVCAEPWAIRQRLTASRVPVLAFSGEADPSDPPRNMSGARRFWPDSRDIALPTQGHSITFGNGWPCESALIQEFIQQASAARLDTACVAAIPATAFPLTLQDLASGG